MEEENHVLDPEAEIGLGDIEGAKTQSVPRDVRRKTIRSFEKHLPYVLNEMNATQEAFDKNFPGELGKFTDDDRWEMLDEENKTLRATYFKKLFQVELTYTAMVRYIETNGKEDLFQEINSVHTAQTFAKHVENSQTETLEEVQPD